MTTSVLNILSEYDDILLWTNKILHLHRSLQRPLVDFHKRELGKQHYCITSEYRYWVWNRSFYNPDTGKKIGWRVYINNKKGICFEVTENSIKEDIYLLFEDYLSAINIKLK